MPDGQFDLAAFLKEGARNPIPMQSQDAAPAAAPATSQAATHLDDNGFPVVGPTPVSAPATTPDPGQPFDLASFLKEGARKALPMPSTQDQPSGIATNVAGEIYKGAARTLGAAVDLPAMAYNAVQRFGGDTANPMPEDAGYNAIMGLVPGAPGGKDYRDIMPQTEGERIASSATGALMTIPQMMLGGEGLAALAPEGSTAANVGRAIVKGPIAPQVLPVAVGGAAGQAASDSSYVPDAWKPYANLTANLLAGGAAAAGQSLVGAGGRAVAGTVGEKLGAMGIGPKQSITTPDGDRILATQTQINKVGQNLKTEIGDEGLTNIDRAIEAQQTADQLRAQLPGETDAAARQALQRQLDAVAPQSLEVVPGSKPTTAQVAQTPGAVGLQEAHATVEGNPFTQRAIDNNTAQLGAIKDLAPADARPQAVGERFQSMLNDLDQAGTEASNATKAGVIAKTDAAGGMSNAQNYGSDMRETLGQGLADKKVQVGKLWDAVDPDGALTVNFAPVQKTASDLLANVNTKFGETLSAPEKMLIKSAAGINDPVVPFASLQTLRSNLGNEISAARSALTPSPQAVRRLTILKNSIDQAIAETINSKSEQDGAAVASGKMAPENAIDARLDQFNEPTGAAEQSATTQMGGSGGTRFGASSASGPNAAIGDLGTGGETNGRSGNVAGSAGVSGGTQPLGNFDQAAAGRFSAAKQARVEQAQTYETGRVGQVLRPGTGGSGFATSDSAVPGAFFSGGPREAEDVSNYIKAAGSKAKAEQLGRDYLVSDLRAKGIIADDGTVKAETFARWRRTHDGAIKQFPGLDDQFSNIAKAQETYDNTVAAHAEAVKSFQNGVAKEFLGSDPLKAVGSAFGSKNPEKTFSQLVDLVRGDKDATEGLKRGVVDYILSKGVGSKPAADGENFLNSATLRKWLDDNKKPLRVVFGGGQGLQNLEMVAADLRRAAQSAAASPGSNTVNKLALGIKHGTISGGHHETASVIIGEQAGGILAHMLGFGPFASKVAELGGAAFRPIVNGMKQAGLETINDLTREAMLHPELARDLTRRIVGKEVPVSLLRRVGSQLHNIAINGVARMDTDNRKIKQ